MVALTVNIIALTDIGQAAAHSTIYSLLQKPQSHLGQPWHTTLSSIFFRPKKFPKLGPCSGASMALIFIEFDIFENF